MSQPRRVVAGTSYLVTRRCSERRLFLRPSPEVNAIILYCLALAAQRFGVELHAYCFLSNHYHLILTDRLGLLPRFEHCLDLLIARALNARYGHFEAFWSTGTYSAVELVDPETILEKIAYTLANPVAAGLVCAAGLWPGVCSRPEDIGAAPRVVPRPGEFFRQAGPKALPAQVALAVVPPPGLDDVSLETVRSLVTERVAAHEEEARKARAGRPFLGRRAVHKQSVFARPKQDDPHFRLNPRVAGSDQSRRAEALERLCRFRQDYRRAWRRLQAGVSELVVFPAGTWQLRRTLAVPCEAPS